jgi:DNA-directed RNA polymerase subunit N (RpoN/RPB10)
MSTYIKCPGCNEDLGCISRAYQELKKKHNELCLNKNKQIDESYVELKPGIIQPMRYILNMLNVENICCRSHLLTYVDFDRIYMVHE